MDFDRLSGDLKTLRRRNRGLAAVVALLATAQLLSAAAVMHLLDGVRTVVVPPSIHKSFWVTGSRASSEYLEQMASFVAWLILDVTASSIDWKKDVLLGYVEPAQQGALRIRQELEAARLKRISASTYFSPQQLLPNEDDQSVLVHGRLRTQVNNLETANDPRSYLVQFSYQGGRIHLTAFREVQREVR